MIDTHGNKAARAEIAMIKVAAPNMACRVIYWAIQAFGDAGVTGDYGLAYAYATARVLRLADGPDEAHRNQIARLGIAQIPGPGEPHRRLGRGVRSRAVARLPLPAGVDRVALKRRSCAGGVTAETERTVPEAGGSGWQAVIQFLFIGESGQSGRSTHFAHCFSSAVHVCSDVSAR
jgi:Acyl-CoA dehydrogenase, C-terminal domain